MMQLDQIVENILGVVRIAMMVFAMIGTISLWVVSDFVCWLVGKVQRMLSNK